MQGKEAIDRESGVRQEPRKTERVWVGDSESVTEDVAP